jgi:hypothetical protein
MTYLTSNLLPNFELSNFELSNLVSNPGLAVKRRRKVVEVTVKEW